MGFSAPAKKDGALKKEDEYHLTSLHRHDTL